MADYIENAQIALEAAQNYLMAAMRSKPTEMSQYSTWIKADQHIRAATQLLKGPEQISLDHWDIVEMSLGCTEHRGPTCLLLRHKTDGRELHIPGTIEKVETRG